MGENLTAKHRDGRHAASPRMTPRGALDFWREWKTVCALDLSSEATRDYLLKFAAHRFKRWVGRYIAATNAREVRQVGISARQAWHLFESHVTVTSTREGKAYKEWLFARRDRRKTNKLDPVQGGASLIMRDVARNYLAAEFSSRDTVSMTTAVAHDGETTLTLAELLPTGSDPSQQIIERELARLADRHARVLFNEMTDRERVALLAKQARLSFSHPAVLKAAGCRKSALHHAYVHVVRRVQERVNRDRRAQEPHSSYSMAGRCLETLFDLMSTWSNGSRQCAHLRKQIEELATI